MISFICNFDCKVGFLFVNLKHKFPIIINYENTLLLKVLPAGLSAVLAGIVLWACQKEKYPDDTIDAEIAASVEMEEYVVAGYELQAALTEFQQAMNATDWSQMHYVQDEDGREVMRLPVQSLVFEAKLNRFNEKKELLQRKYRRLTSYSPEQCEALIQNCLDNSVQVATKLLDMGFNVYLPRTKAILEPFTEESLIDSLRRYVTNPNHVEALFVGYENHRYDIYVSDSNTRYSAWPPNIVQNGNRYFWRGGSQPNSPINLIGHTHFGNDSIPSSVDSSAIRLPGVRYVIFTNGEFRDF